MTSCHSRMSKLAVATLLAMGSTTAGAAGFAIAEQSVTGLGNAFAGGAAAAEDASTVFFNPAGMTELDGVQYNLGIHLIQPKAEFEDQGSSNTLASAILMSAQSLDANNEDGGDAGNLNVVPNFYYSRDLGNKWTVGLGVNAPFGLTTDYENDWVGRYHGITSELVTVNLNPSAAYEVSDTFSVGFGLNAQYVEARLTSAIDYGSLGSALMIGAFTPQGFDGEADIQGDDFSFGYNFGFLWKPAAETRIGLAYRSRIKHELEGEVGYTIPAAVSAVATALSHVNGSDVEADLELPASLALGFHHQVSPKLAVMGDYTWTGWSTLDELRVTYDSGANDSVNDLDWDNTNRYSLGMTYQYNEQWTWRAGVAFDETPIPDAEHRTPRIPGEDRSWVTLGFSYHPGKTFVIDLGYAHLFVEDAEINQVDTGALTDENFGRGSLVGKYESEVNILSAQARWLF